MSANLDAALRVLKASMHAPTLLVQYTLIH